MSQAPDNKRKVTRTGILSYLGCKYYVRNKELWGTIVEVQGENEDQTLNITLGETKDLAFSIQLVKR